MIIVDAWILTAGVNNGVANLIGEGISHYRLLKEHPKPVTCIGLAQWGSITEEARRELKEASPVRVVFERIEHFIDDRCVLSLGLSDRNENDSTN